jgi:alkylation response protein AidB-like acyl-CoA dehydrogenase
MGDDCTSEIPMAKHPTGELANRVAYDAAPIFGGDGYVRESPVERFHRGARLWPIGAERRRS